MRVNLTAPLEDAARGLDVPEPFAVLMGEFVMDSGDRVGGSINLHLSDTVWIPGSTSGS